MQIGNKPILKTNGWPQIIIFLVVGVAMLLFDAHLIKNNLDFLQVSKKTEGEVIEVVSTISDKGTMFRPKVSFMDEGGREVTFVSDTSSNTPTFRQGEKVQVLYDPNIPEYAKINSFSQIWLGVLMLSFLGLVFFIVPIFQIVNKFKKKEPNNPVLI